MKLCAYLYITTITAWYYPYFLPFGYIEALKACFELKIRCLHPKVLYGRRLIFCLLIVKQNRIILYTTERRAFYGYYKR